MAGNTAAPASSITAKLPFWLSLGALVSFALGWLFAGENDENGWIWFVMAVLAAGALVTGLLATRAGRRDGRTMAGTVIGGLLTILFLLFAFGILE